MLQIKRKLFKTFTSKKHYPGILVLSPARDWRILVLVFFVLVTGLFVFHYAIYTHFRAVALIDEGKVLSDVETFDRDLLTRVVEAYRIKESEYASYLASPPEIVDPSL